MEAIYRLGELMRAIGLFALLAGAATPAMAAAPQPPSTAEAMAALCGTAPVDEDGCMVEGQHITAWQGVSYEIGDVPGFALLATVTEEADSGEINYSAPGDMLSLAQVSYQFKDGRWTRTGREINFGSIATSGAAGNPPIAETAKPLFRLKTDDGVMVGIPTTRLALGGIAIAGYSLFRSKPEKNGLGWIYAGDVVTGTDNGADCDAEAADRPCYASTGTLKPAGTKAPALPHWPLLAVSQTGTVMGNDGKVHELRKSSGVILNYDAKRGDYTALRLH